MGQMAAGSIALANVPQEELHGGDRREHPVTPPGLPNLATHGQDGVGLQQRSPFACQALKDGSDTRDHGGHLLHDGVLSGGLEPSMHE
jgi:hypothetical protein